MTQINGDDGDEKGLVSRICNHPLPVSHTEFIEMRLHEGFVFIWHTANGTLIDVPLSAMQFIHKTGYSVSDILEGNAVGVVDLSGIGYLVFQHIVQAAELVWLVLYN